MKSKREIGLLFAWFTMMFCVVVFSEALADEESAEFYANGKRYHSLKAYRIETQPQEKNIPQVSDDGDIFQMIENVMAPWEGKASFSKDEVKTLIMDFYLKLSAAAEKNGEGEVEDMQKMMREYKDKYGLEKNYEIDPKKMKTIMLKKDEKKSP